MARRHGASASGAGRRPSALRLMVVLFTSSLLISVLSTCRQPLELYKTVEKAVAAANPTEPDAPSNLTAVGVSSGQIDLSWKDESDNEDEFEIQRKSGGGFETIDTAGADSTGYSDTGLDAETGYTYRVRAVNAEGASGWTDEASATTEPAPTEPPAAPENVELSEVSPDQIDVTWSIPGNSRAEGFRVEYKPDGGSFSQAADLTGLQTSYNHHGLHSETKYYYRVRAYNEAGVSSWVSGWHLNTGELGATTTELAAPSNVEASVVDYHRVCVTWTDESSFEDYFEIQRRRQESDESWGSWEKAAEVAADNSEYIDTGLAADATYEFQICAGDFVDEAGVGGKSDAISTPVPVRTDRFKTSVIADAVGLAYDTNLAVSSDGVPHVVWAAGDDGQYAHLEGGTWVRETIPDCGGNTSITAEDGGGVCIAYQSDPGYGLTFARRTGDSWDTVEVDPSDDLVFDTAIALDDEGNAHVAYINIDSLVGDDVCELRYAMETSGGWNTEVIDSAPHDSGNELGYPTIDVDGSNNPHIVYVDEAANEAVYAYREGQSWTVEPTGLTVSSNVALALRPNTFIPLVAYVSPSSSSGVRVGEYYDDSYWVGFDVDSDAIGTRVDIICDTDGDYHIAYGEFAGKTVRYGYQVGNMMHESHIDTVDEVDDVVSSQPSIAFGSDNKVRILYYDYGTDQLKYAADMK